MVKAVIFDIDGTLLDSVDLHGQAWQEAFRQFGHDVRFEDARAQIGKGADHLLPVFLSKEDIERYGEDLTEFRAKLFKEKYLHRVKPFPGVRELLLKIKDRGQKIALASSARGDELKHYEQLANIEDLVEAATSSADAKQSKPNPDIIEAALKRLGSDLDCRHVMMVGDSPHDAEAATRAGVQAIGVRCGGFPEDALRQAGCIAIYDGPADLSQHYGQSPLAVPAEQRSGGNSATA